ncbi:hypothetical protein G6F57_007545 [Rhizopus arrhizus]|uniref:Uncharacterized protein n=1 Tax=Rhizopus oryzae TaxID=64495 RepID=A0A9P7BU62_RHIOR|nr:hypothetical protein G6F30_005041 [Rhizopus arrhizus]KAG1421580.1 hypothetical protein G6F58_003697 [Rhizopus delemar]KAG0988958.1 hypothetical protein G6F29_001341 [Rhizopus arrhizus]KAG0995618.1 hypothetical protein G6F28_004625 [Rhizopus arrhizus]KAG1005827.1 hypothetical protein G6F27_008871 [Rhizopus arrhizus]
MTRAEVVASDGVLDDFSGGKPKITCLFNRLSARPLQSIMPVFSRYHYWAGYKTLLSEIDNLQHNTDARDTTRSLNPPMAPQFSL